MNPYVNDDLVALAEQDRRYAVGRVAPGFLERDQTPVLDRTIMLEMGDMGFIAPELPQAYGDQELGNLAAGVIHEEIAHAELSISQYMQERLIVLDELPATPVGKVQKFKLRDMLQYGSL